MAKKAIKGSVRKGICEELVCIFFCFLFLNYF